MKQIKGGGGVTPAKWWYCPTNPIECGAPQAQCNANCQVLYASLQPIVRNSGVWFCRTAWARAMPLGKRFTLSPLGTTVLMYC